MTDTDPWRYDEALYAATRTIPTRSGPVTIGFLAPDREQAGQPVIYQAYRRNRQIGDTARYDMDEGETFGQAQEVIVQMIREQGVVGHGSINPR